MSLHRVLLAALTATALAAPALGQEVLTQGETGAPPSEPAAAARLAAPSSTPAQDNTSPEAIGRWAQRILDGKPAEAPERPADGKRLQGCAAAQDSKPHGEVWAGVGTRGYREVGVVTQAVGECGRVTIAIDKTDFGGRRH